MRQFHPGKYIGKHNVKRKLLDEIGEMLKVLLNLGWRLVEEIQQTGFRLYLIHEKPFLVRLGDFDTAHRARRGPAHSIVVDHFAVRSL